MILVSLKQFCVLVQSENVISSMDKNMTQRRDS